MKSLAVCSLVIVIALGTAWASSETGGVQDNRMQPEEFVPVPSSALIASWRATAISSDYLAPKTPI